MRVKIGDNIYTFTEVEHPGGSDKVFVTNDRDHYTINCGTVEAANQFVHKLFVDGYADVNENNLSVTN